MAKYIVATVDAVFVFVGAMLALMLLPVVAFRRLYESDGSLIAAYAVGLVHAATAAVLSFRATPRTYRHGVVRRSLSWVTATSSFVAKSAARTTSTAPGREPRRFARF